MIFHWSLSDSKSSQVSRTFLSIQADQYYTVVWVVSTRPLIYNFSSPLPKLWGIIPSDPITIDIFDTFMFLSFFSSLVRFQYLSLF